MTELQQAPPQLGQHGDPCGQCGAPLAIDQRYCLNCGARRAGPRVDTARYLEAGPAAPPERVREVAPAAEPPAERQDYTAIWGVGLLMVLGVMFVVGVLIGKEDSKAPVAAQQPVIRLGGATAGTGAGTGGGGPAAAGTTEETAATFRSDWPQGKEGFTVELGNLPKQSTSAAQVEAAKADVKAKGATGVGALDSDQYASLPPGNYLVYSGVYDKRADAEKALGKLQGKFPDAQVVEVSKDAGGGGGAGATTVSVPNTNPVDSLTTPGAGNGDQPVTASEQALEELDNATGEEYQDAVRNLPETIAIPGEAPPTDNQAPGGGSGAITIGGG